MRWYFNKSNLNRTYLTFKCHCYYCCPAGVYRSLQQSYNICSQDVLTAMDYCEESLQEIDITSFLQTLCGHVRDFQENADIQSEEIPGNATSSPTLVIDEAEEDGTSSSSPR